MNDELSTDMVPVGSNVDMLERLQRQAHRQGAPLGKKVIFALSLEN